MAGYGNADDAIGAVQNHIDDSIALNRISVENQANYTGLCLECDDPISPERLEAIPNSKRCIYCQEEWESCQRGFNRFRVRNIYVP